MDRIEVIGAHKNVLVSFYFLLILFAHEFYVGLMVFRGIHTIRIDEKGKGA